MARRPTAATDVTVGGPGGVGRATTGSEGADAGPAPTLLFATAVHV